MWTTDALIFDEDGEDEEALISDFVKFSALHPEVQPQEITQYLFKGLRDPDARSFQASIIWSRDLGIKERIRLARREGVDKVEELTIEKWEAQVYALTIDFTIPPQDKKIALEGYMNIATVKGWIKKAIDKTIKDDRISFPQIVIAQYPDA